MRKEKHMPKTKCTKHTRSEPLLELEMSTKCTPFWREAHLQVKMLNATHVRPTFGRHNAVARGRSKELCTLPNVKLLKQFQLQPPAHYTTGHFTPIKHTYKVVGLSHIFPLKAHLVWQAPRKTQGTSRRRSHITSIVFCNDSLRAPTNSANYRKCLK